MRVILTAARNRSSAQSGFTLVELMTPYGAQCNMPGTVNGLDGAGGTPWQASFPQFYHPDGDNFAYLRNTPFDESELK